MAQLLDDFGVSLKKCRVMSMSKAIRESASEQWKNAFIVGCRLYILFYTLIVWERQQKSIFWASSRGQHWKLHKKRICQPEWLPMSMPSSKAFVQATPKTFRRKMSCSSWRRRCGGYPPRYETTRLLNSGASANQFLAPVLRQEMEKLKIQMLQLHAISWTGKSDPSLLVNP